MRARGAMPAKKERLTWRQISARYPDEWVALSDEQWRHDRRGKVLLSAVVLSHSKSYWESLEFTEIAPAPRAFSHGYTGKK